MIRASLLALLLLVRVAAAQELASVEIAQEPFPDPFMLPPQVLRSLTVTVAGAGTGTVSGTGIDCGADCGHVYNRGAQVTLTATPTGGSTFTGWSGACSGTGSCVVTMTNSATVTATFAAPAPPTTAFNTALRFYGHGDTAPDLDRVKVQIDALPPDSGPGPAIDVGAGNFTIEFWLRPMGTNNGNCSAGATNSWINGNGIVDRDRFNQPRSYGISLCAGRIAFGVDNASGSQRTIVGTTDLRSAVVSGSPWHHVAVTRNATSGAMTLFVNGTQEASFTGPTGDISYPDDGVPCATCCGGSNCNFSDPFIVLGAEKHDFDSSQFPSYSGLMDELRYSNNIRYTGNFTRPSAPLLVDANTIALYRFDEATGTVTADATGTSAHQGTLRVGGAPPAGPEWVLSGVPTNDLFFTSAECPHVNGVPVNTNDLMCDDFEDGNWALQCNANDSGAAVLLANDGWHICNGGPRNPPPPSTICDGTGAGNSRCFAVSTLSGGDGGGGMLGLRGFYPNNATYQEIYLRMMIRLSSGYVENNNQKFISLIQSAFQGGIDYGGVGRRIRDLLMATQYDCSDNNYQNPQSSGPVWCYNNQNQGNNYQLALGVWNYVEYRFRLNDYCFTEPPIPSTHPCRNGIYQVWANNCGAQGICTGTPTLRASYTNIGWKGDYFGTGATANGLIGGAWLDIWGNPADVGTIHLDNIRVSRAFIGFPSTLSQP